MKAIVKLDIPTDKWVIDVETCYGDIFPVGKMVHKDLGLFETRKWDSRKQAEEWVKSKGLILA